jgi:hypothetical protein
MRFRIGRPSIKTLGHFVTWLHLGSRLATNEACDNACVLPWRRAANRLLCYCGVDVTPGLFHHQRSVDVPWQHRQPDRLIN